MIRLAVCSQHALTSHLFPAYCDATDGKLSLESIHLFCIILNNYMWQRKQHKVIQQLSTTHNYCISEGVSLPHLFFFGHFPLSNPFLVDKLGLLYHPALSIVMCWKYSYNLVFQVRNECPVKKLLVKLSLYHITNLRFNLLINLFYFNSHKFCISFWN